MTKQSSLSIYLSFRFLFVYFVSVILVGGGCERGGRQKQDEGWEKEG